MDCEDTEHYMDDGKDIYVWSAYISAQYITGRSQNCHQNVKLFPYLFSGDSDSVYFPEDNEGMDCTVACGRSVTVLRDGL